METFLKTSPAVHSETARMAEDAATTPAETATSVVGRTTADAETTTAAGDRTGRSASAAAELTTAAKTPPPVRYVQSD